MFHGGLHHGNLSTYSLPQRSRSRSPQLHKVTAYESESDVSGLESLDDLDGQHGHELEDLHRAKADADFHDSDDNNGGRLRRHRNHKGSTSNAQTAKLYTLGEERMVRRKFDRRLVLFVAFLYMLSFLDRSST